MDFSNDLANFRAFRPASWRIHLKTFEVRPGLNIMIFEDVLWLKIYKYLNKYINIYINI